MKPARSADEDWPVRLAFASALALPLGTVLAAGLLAAARWPEYWLWIALEQTPFTFIKALLLFSAALFAGLTALSGRLLGLPDGENHWWLAVSAGFLYLMADDRFALHERLRDRILAGWGLRLPWGAPGDYILVLYLLAGLILLPVLLRLMRRDPSARKLFIAAAVLAALVVAVDSFDPAAMSLAVERLEQTLEEVVQGVADALFAAAFFTVFMRRLSLLAAGGGVTGRDSAGPRR